MTGNDRFDALSWDAIDEVTPNDNSSYSKKVNKPTQKGAYAIEYYFDEQGNPCAEKNASQIRTREFDEQNNFVFETVRYVENEEATSAQDGVAKNVFDPQNWDIEYALPEVTSVCVEFFDCQYFRYDRKTQSVLFTLNMNHREYIDNYTEFGRKVITSGNTVRLTNEQHNEFLHLMEDDILAPLANVNVLMYPVSVTLIYTDGSQKTVSSATKKVSEGKVNFYSNAFLDNLDAFLRKNFQKEMWEIDYSVEYLCPCCGKPFVKAYTGMIFHNDHPIVCDHCGFDLISKQVLTGGSTERKAYGAVSAGTEKLQTDTATLQTDAAQLHADTAKIQADLAKLKSRRKVYIGLIIGSLVLAGLMMAIIPVGFVVFAVLFWVFVVATIIINNKINTLQNALKINQQINGNYKVGE